MNIKLLQIKFTDDIKTIISTDHSYKVTKSLAILDHSDKMWVYAVKCKAIHLAVWNEAKLVDFIL